MGIQIKAAVLRDNGGPLTIESLTLDDPLDDEVLVRIMATGICHTDHEVISGNMPPQPPVVMGHEGAGIVERVGSAINHVRPGDHVVLSFPSCGTCPACRSGIPVRCPDVIALSLSGARTDGSGTLLDRSGKSVNGSFFGQSSFASHALARAPNVVRIDKEIPFEIAAPLGCGIQTGAGTVINTLKPKAGSSIAIFGVGAVGMAAVMAARVAGCEKIVAVDAHASRLLLARDLGATHIVDVNGLDLDEVVSAVGETDYSIEASGNQQAINAAIRVIRINGCCAFLGVSKPGTTINVDHYHILNSRTIVGVMQGDSNPQTFIPELIGLYLKGELPLERIIKIFAFADINAAFDASISGTVIKPVLLMTS
ncbi:MAG: NAD(P)-dependent alcohol dehydrogenase [Porticoccaceae bacterium]